MSIQNSSIVGSPQGVICNGKTFLALVHSRFIGAHGGPETRRPNYRKGYLGAREFRSSVVIRATSLEHTQTITNQTETLTNASCRMLRLCDFLHNMLSGVPPENTPENPQVGLRSKHSSFRTMSDIRTSHQALELSVQALELCLAFSPWIHPGVVRIEGTPYVRPGGS